MSDDDRKIKVSDDGGCLLVVGLVITAIAVGYLTSAPWGWLVIGVGLLVIGLSASMRND